MQHTKSSLRAPAQCSRSEVEGKGRHLHLRSLRDAARRAPWHRPPRRFALYTPSPSTPCGAPEAVQCATPCGAPEGVRAVSWRGGQVWCSADRLALFTSCQVV